MKIAVLLFGHLRTFEHTGPYLKKNLLDKYDCDVFIHTWDTMDSGTVAWDGKQANVVPVDERVLARVRELFSPKSIEIGHQDIGNDTIVHSLVDSKKTSLAGIHYMFESMSSANAQCQKYARDNNIDYDLVVVTRPDVAIYNAPDLSAVLSEAEILNLDVSHCRFFAGLYGSAATNVRLLISRVSDIFFFGRPAVIDTYIESNRHISREYAEQHFLNVVTIYASNEIKAGLMPIELCFACGEDWKNVKPSDMNQFRNITKKQSVLHRFIQKITGARK